MHPTMELIQWPKILDKASNTRVALLVWGSNNSRKDASDARARPVWEPSGGRSREAGTLTCTGPGIPRFVIKVNVKWKTGRIGCNCILGSRTFWGQAGRPAGHPPPGQTDQTRQIQSFRPQTLYIILKMLLPIVCQRQLLCYHMVLIEKHLYNILYM